MTLTDDNIPDISAIELHKLLVVYAIVTLHKIYLVDYYRQHMLEWWLKGIAEHKKDLYWKITEGSKDTIDTKQNPKNPLPDEYIINHVDELWNTLIGSQAPTTIEKSPVHHQDFIDFAVLIINNNSTNRGLHRHSALLNLLTKEIEQHAKKEKEQHVKNAVFSSTISPECSRASGFQGVSTGSESKREVDNLPQQHSL